MLIIHVMSLFNLKDETSKCMRLTARACSVVGMNLTKMLDLHLPSFLTQMKFMKGLDNI